MITNEITPIISVIVPVYQVEPYLKDCLDSIIAQSFTDWELLLIDDGSTDGGEAVCDEYGAKDSRVRVFHQENRGLSAARNLGIDNARGEYFAMVDADDVLLSHDYLRLLYEAIIDNDAEVSVCDFGIVRGNSHPALFDSERRDVTILSGKDVFSYNRHDMMRFSSACAKIYHRSCFDHIRYPEGRLIEDGLTFHHLIYPIKRIAVIDLEMYGRRMREGSIVTGTPNAVLFQETLSAKNDCIKYLSEHEDEEAALLTEQRCKSYLRFHYLQAIKDGSVNQIPEEIMPRPEDFDAECGYANLLHFFRNVDSEGTYTQTRSYRNQVSKDSINLLIMSFDIVSDRNTSVLPIDSESNRVEDISINEALSIPFHEAMSVNGSLSAEERDRHLQYVRHAMQKSILSWNHEKRLREEMEKDELCLIPFVPDELMGAYKKPWMRETKNRKYWIEKNKLQTLRSIMERMGFTEAEVDPFEVERNVEWVFEHRDGTCFTFFTGTPIHFSIKHKKAIEMIFERVLSEQRALTTTEYAIVLIAKIHTPNCSIASTKLRDLLDLLLIMNNAQQSFDNATFKSMLMDYSLDEEWNRIDSFCRKILNYSYACSYTQNDLDFIFNIIGTPMHRLSYLKKKSECYFRAGQLSDPIEYALSINKKIAYLVNSKAACSSIKTAMLDEELPDGYEVHQTYIDRGMNRSNLDAKEDSFFTFSFVRNPLSRLVSCYLNRFSANAKKYEYLLGYLGKDEGFSSFVERICALPYRLMDKHFRRQYDLIYDENGASRCDYVGHFERIEEDFNSIREKYDLHELPHLNVSGSDNWMDYYTNETAELVYETFKTDFLTFGYKNNYQELISHLEKKETTE